VHTRLIGTAVPADPEAAVLVLHGGAHRPGRTLVSPTQLSVLRMVPIARRIARAGRGRLAVFRVLNSHRGWDTRHTPVHDVEWAMAEVHRRLGDLPVGLVGHSLGGRAALLAGPADPVRLVVALNPWVHPTDTADLTGRRVLVVHGSDDRVALPERARIVARALARSAVEVDFVTVPGGRHAMLRHARQFERPAARFVVRNLLDVP
jgi:alpha-beta hydrolase superfamily lysophospholipase